MQRQLSGSRCGSSSGHDHCSSRQANCRCPSVSPETSCPAPCLTPGQVEQFVRDGFVLARGLVSAELCRRAAAAVWEQMEGPGLPDSQDVWNRGQRLHPSVSDRTTWPAPGKQWAGVIGGPAIASTFTPACQAAAQQLVVAATAAAKYPISETSIVAPLSTLALNLFPRGERKDVRCATPHVDVFKHADGAGWAIEPRPMVLQQITYLQCSGAPGGGGTFVWPGSHRRLDEIFLSDKERYRYLSDLAPQVEAVCVGIEPVEVVPQAGDVLFYGMLTAHSGSSNSSDVVRLAYNHKYSATCVDGWPFIDKEQFV
jgi:hypothetical protein